MTRVRPPMGHCNIGQKGISWRSWLAMMLVILGFYFELPLITFFAGFTWYESRAKWCITQSVMQ